MLLPLRDSNPSGTRPYVTYGLIALNVLVYLFEVTLSDQQLREFFLRYGVVPALVTGSAKMENYGTFELARSFVSTQFLHAGFFHLLSNMWYLWIFGDNVEDRIGHIRFAAFYLACGFGASLAQIVAGPGSTIPMVGASGAISGVLGAYWVCFPRARVRSLFVWFLLDLPASFVLGFWFFMQVFEGLGSLGVAGGGVAWWAHIGGFVAGVALIRMVPRRRGAQQSTYRVRFDGNRKYIDID